MEGISRRSRKRGVSARVEKTSSLTEVDWFFFGTYASEHCKESLVQLHEEMDLDTFFKLHEYCRIMSDINREKQEEAEANRSKS